MTVAFAIAAAVLAGCGAYLLMSGSLSRVVLGGGLISHAANIVIVLAGGEGGAPVFAGDDGPFGDPLPQAMVLTAIVITLGVTALLLAISYRSWQLVGDDPVEGADPIEGADSIEGADPIEGPDSIEGADPIEVDGTTDRAGGTR
jgi:multicomponent Na+:H+ antiporter subunit C